MIRFTRLGGIGCAPIWVRRHRLKSYSPIFIRCLSKASRRSMAHGTSRNATDMRSFAMVSTMDWAVICSVRSTLHPPAAMTPSAWAIATWYIGGIMRKRSDWTRLWFIASVMAAHMRLLC